MKHEAIQTLVWPSMTMPFGAAPPIRLKSLKVGQRIAFDTNKGIGIPLLIADREPRR